MNRDFTLDEIFHTTSPSDSLSVWGALNSSDISIIYICHEEFIIQVHKHIPISRKTETDRYYVSADSVRILSWRRIQS